MQLGNLSMSKKCIHKFDAIKKNSLSWMLIIPSLILFYYIVWRPIAMAIGLSFFDLKGFKPIEFIGLKNYIDVVTDMDFLKIVWNSFQYVLWSLLIGFPIPFFLAVFLNEIVKGKGMFRVLLYLPAVIPGIAVYMIWNFFYIPDKNGLLNLILSFIGVGPFTWLQNSSLTIPLMVIASTWQGFGSTTIIYLASLQGINRELYEAVRIDGGGVFQRFKQVILPHMIPTLLLMAIRQIISVFQILEMPLVMTGGGPNGASLSVGLQSYRYAFEFGQADKGIALGVLTFVAMAVLTIFYVWVEKRINN